MKKIINSIAIVAGGNLYSIHLKQIKQADFIVGVDRGAYWLVKHHILPDLAIGDFDSLSPSQQIFVERKIKNVIAYPAKKDATDLELAIDQAIKRKPTVVKIYGGLGTRFDHSMGAVNMLTKLESHNIYGEIVDKFNQINIVRRKLRVTKNPFYRYISIIPLDSKTTVTLHGFLYNVSRRVFPTHTTLGISNEISGTKATILVHTGSALVVQNSDERVR